MTLPMANAAEMPASDLGRLQRSLQLAAMGRDVSALIADLADLRNNARAKRALWPKLRALRRSH
jgi:DNA polymerase III psi subunit